MPPASEKHLAERVGTVRWRKNQRYDSYGAIHGRPLERPCIIENCGTVAENTWHHNLITIIKDQDEALQNNIYQCESDGIRYAKCVF